MEIVVMMGSVFRRKYEKKGMIMIFTYDHTLFIINFGENKVNLI